MNLQELENSGHIILKAISGSKAYGLDGPNSDTDIKGVFILPKDQYYSIKYISQIADEKNDIVYYELNKFIELALKNNPNILELLLADGEHILFKDPIFNQLKIGDFLSKKCELSFANYAFTQIKKARGLEKKIVNPMVKTKKTVLDFCYVYHDQKVINLIEFLAEKLIQQSDCGLTSVPHIKGAYNLYHSFDKNYKGIAQSEDSNDISTSSVLMNENAIGLLYFNKDGYSTYCKKYKAYWEWVEKRNDSRYQTTVEHGKNYDAKNMMHTFRLLRMAEEIARDQSLNIKREDRDYLLKIKNGHFEYEELIAAAESIKSKLPYLYQSSALLEQPNREHIQKIAVQMRDVFYRKQASNSSHPHD